MKNLICCTCLSLFLLFLCAPAAFSKTSLFINRIEGIIYDPNRTPVNDVRVELLNDVGSFIAGTKTMSGGRFTFSVTGTGRFTVRVVPTGMSFLEETKDVEIYTGNRRASDTVYTELYLRYDKRNREEVPTGPAEAIFVQEIPKEAKKLYQTGIKSLSKNDPNGLLEIEKSLEIFPDYFEALNRLGREYNSRKDYNKSYPYLLRATTLNSRSITSFYNLSYAYFQLNNIPEALKAAEALTTIDPSYVEGQLLYGILLRVSKNYKAAEITLLKAKSISKKPNFEIYWQIALLYNKLNRNQDAANELENYLKLEPQSPDKAKVEELIAKLKNSKTT